MNAHEESLMTDFQKCDNATQMDSEVYEIWKWDGKAVEY
jgi:hypothetical protein